MASDLHSRTFFQENFIRDILQVSRQKFQPIFLFLTYKIFLLPVPLKATGITSTIFGYEPNRKTMANGQALIVTVSAMSSEPC